LSSSSNEYLAAAGIREDGKTPLFRSAIGKTGVLTGKPMNRVDAYRMIRRRTTEAGLKGKLGCHVFRATGITAYLEAKAASTRFSRCWALPKGGRRFSSHV
jgi:integrase/recombinase XerD